MQLSTILAALTAVAVSAGPIAAPVASPLESLTTESPGVEVKVYPDGLPKELIPRAVESGLAKRANDGVYLCTDRNFGGYCVHIVAPYYQCVGLGNDLNDLVSSLGPDSGYCFFFRDFNCQDNGNPYNHFGTYAPGFSDLTVNGFNDQISSYYCNPN
ncbi:hypothetical protein MMC31_002519 [Peltigera leucophlebia]|nr:hypothetical protein [Peltigera leucophlebia]